MERTACGHEVRLDAYSVEVVLCDLVDQILHGCLPLSGADPEIPECCNSNRNEGDQYEDHRDRGQQFEECVSFVVLHLNPMPTFVRGSTSFLLLRSRFSAFSSASSSA